MQGKEPEFLMRIGFDCLDRCLLSIAHRRLSNRGSGLIRHEGHPNGTRTINGVKIHGVYGDRENKEDARLYHNTYEEHIKSLGLNKLEKEKDFVMIGNGNLGNNFWHVAWQYDKEKRLYCLKDEPYSYLVSRYSCFVVPKKGNPKIMKVGFDQDKDLFGYTESNSYEKENISNEINWVNYGQQIIKTENGETNTVPIEELIDEFYDIKHIFELKNWSDGTNEGDSKMKRDFAIINKIYENYPGIYPDTYRGKILKMIEQGFPRAEYYHSTLGIDNEGIVLYHSKGKIEDIAKRLVDKGVKDSIILDQGGSVGTYASWVYPNGGYINRSSYFRPNRISTIAFVINQNGI